MNQRIMDSLAIGIAGELRVMSELLIRGINSAKPFLDDGVDLVMLHNGKRLSVKSGKKRTEARGFKRYLITVGRGGSNSKMMKMADSEVSDFTICWCIDDDIFYIIPTKAIQNKRSIVFSLGGKNKKYSQWEGRWDLLL